MNFLKKIFHRRREKKLSIINYPLSIDGVTPAPLTAEPDESELAAAAFLESFAERRNHGTTEPRKSANPAKGSKEYYKALSEKIKAAHEQDRRAALRYVAYCEAQITSAISPQPSDIAMLKQGLFKYQNTVEREGGNLKRRWQHCLAEVTIRQMQAVADSENIKS